MNNDAVKKMMEVCIHDLDAGGWDAPPRFYAIMGTVDDPYLILMTEAIGSQHPIEVLRQMSKDGMWLPTESIGLLTTNEGWRHLSWEELNEEFKDEDYLDSVRKGLDLLTDKPGDENEYARLWGQYLVEAAPGPSRLPPRLRREVRQVTFCLKDGPTHGASHQVRGDDEVTHFISGEGGEVQGRVPDAMAAYVAGNFFVENPGANVVKVKVNPDLAPDELAVKVEGTIKGRGAQEIIDSLRKKPD